MLKKGIILKLDNDKNSNAMNDEINFGDQNVCNESTSQGTHTTDDFVSKFENGLNDTSAYKVKVDNKKA